MIAQIAGTGSYVPERRVDNKEIFASVHRDEAGIFRRTGIRERRWADPRQATSDLATEAGRAALASAGLAPSELEAIVLSTTSPDMPFPSTACLVQKNLQARKAFAFDVAASCSGFLFALSAAEQFIRSGRSRNALVVAAEIKSRFLDLSDPNTAFLFGDGAGAVVLKASEGEPGILSIRLHTDGARHGLITMPAGGSRNPTSESTIRRREHFIRMKGASLFKAAVLGLTEVAHEILKAHGLRPSDIAQFVFHQANARILSAVLRRLAVPQERAVTILERYGNTSSASLPMALDHLVKSGGVRNQDLLFFGAFGGGLNWGGALVRWQAP